MLVRYPGRWLAALRLTLAMCRKTDRSIPLHIVSFLEGARLARDMMAAGVRHLHAHFGTNAAEIAMLGATMAGIPYSFTVHGPDEFDRPLSTKLGLKIARAAHVVAITDFCASQLYRWARLEDWHKVKVVRCGLLPDFLDVPLTPPADAPHFVCIGRLSGQKGSCC